VRLPFPLFFGTNAQITFRAFYDRCLMPVIALNDNHCFIRCDGPFVLFSIARLPARSLAGQLAADALSSSSPN